MGQNKQTNEQKRQGLLLCAAGLHMLTFSQHVVSVLATDITVGEVLWTKTWQLIFISCSYRKSLEWISLFVEIGVNYPRAKTSMKLISLQCCVQLSRKEVGGCWERGKGQRQEKKHHGGLVEFFANFTSVGDYLGCVTTIAAFFPQG